MPLAKNTVFAHWMKLISVYCREQSRPLRPSRPPPKPDHNSERTVVTSSGGHFPVTNIVSNKSRAVGNTGANNSRPVGNLTNNNNNNNRPSPRPKQAARNVNSRHISEPVLTGSTNKDSKSHIQLSPIPAHKRDPQVPPKPVRPSSPPAVQSAVHPPLPTKSTEKTDKSRGAADVKAKFNQILKIPSFSKSKEDTELKETKPDTNKPESPQTANIVKKREINRQISNPVLISTTDRRSMHFVKQENPHTVPLESSDTPEAPPPIPPHVSISRSESENTHKNRPLPPRPLSMPESECGDEDHVDPREARKSVGILGRMPDRPPPPPVNPNLDRTRLNIEAELARIDNIQLELADEGRSSDNDSTSGKFTKSKPSTTSKPKTSAKPKVSKANSDSTKKPMIPSKSAALKTKSEPRNTHELRAVEPPTFNPKARSGVSKPTSVASDKISSNAPKAQPRAKNISGDTVPRKDSTDSIEDDPSSGAASVSGLTQMFEVQKKPLLQEKRSGGRPKIHGEPKVPMAPPKPKPEARKLRSVNV